MRFCFLLFLLLVAQGPAYAQWYQAEGHAIILHGDKDKARTKATENALKKALLVAGASVSSVQQVVNGMLTQDELNIRASGSVNSVELLEETYKDNKISVSIRADIFPQEKVCFSADYKKTLLMTRSKLLNREQANIGGIYQLDRQVIHKMAEKIRHQGQYLHTQLATQSSTNFSRLNNGLQSEEIKALSMSLSQMTDSQFVLFSEIEDISFVDEAESNWQFWQDDVFQRHFKMTIYIYNGNNGELVFTRDYANQAPWQYSKRTMVDVRSTTFWQSQYGLVVNELLDDMITDIDENMMCQPTRGKIVRVNGNQVSFNLGAKHGVKLNDEFSLLHLSNFMGDNGKSYAGFNVSPFKVKVIDVTRDSATAITTDEHLLGNIQVNDIAVRY